jgi:hypothetical protein
MSIKTEIKSQLAKLLATENITLQHNPGTTTAYFDTKNRILVLPVWKDISEDLYDLLVVHETGHAIDTPTEGWMEAIEKIAEKFYPGKVNDNIKVAVKDFLNVCEDPRIDRRQKRRYPGSIKNYVEGYKELHARDFFGLKKLAEQGKELNDLTFIDRANIYFKHGATFGIKFSDKEQTYINRMAKTESFEEVVAITEEIFQYAKDEENLQVPQPQTGSGKLEIEIEFTEGDDDAEGDFNLELEVEGEGDGDEGDEGDNDHGGVYSSKSGKGKDGDKDGEEKKDDGKPTIKAKLKKEEKSDSKEDGEGDEDKDVDEASDPKTKIAKVKVPAKQIKQHEKKEFGRVSDVKETTFVPEVKTEQAAQKNAQAITHNTGENYVYLELPKIVDWKNVIDDYSVVVPQMEASVNSVRKNNVHMGYNSEAELERLAKSLATWKAAEKDSISFMVKEFEMRKAADTNMRVATAKTGVINTNKLFSYVYNEDIFRRQTVLPKGKNHGFVMIMDWSGSMRDQLKGTLQQLFALTMFCKKVQIPFEVYLFRSLTRNELGPVGRGQWRNKSGGAPDINFDYFKLRNVLSSRMNAPTMNKAMECLWMMQRLNAESDPMGSTPLNQAILCTDHLVREFQKRSKAEIVSAIILTDGASDGARFAKNGINNGKPNQFFVTDPVTKKTIETGGPFGYKFTSGCLEILRARVQCHVVGFYIYNGVLDYLSHFGINAYDPKSQAQWKENKFLATTAAGYDEYYIVNAQAMRNPRDESLNIGSNTSVNRAAKEFIRFSEKKKVSRGMLTNFIDRISKHYQSSKK